jgi:leucyl-tRNA synthetase
LAARERSDRGACNADPLARIAPENYAVEHGVHPGDTTRRFADNYRRQLKLIECSYDWSRELCLGNDRRGGLGRRCERARHALIRRVTTDFDAFRFNTAIAAMMELLAFAAQRSPSEAERRRVLETLTVLLSPICPFITEEVWRVVLGNEDSVHRQPWPTYDAHLAAPDQWTIVLQVNGKVRDRLNVPVGTDAATLERLARASDAVRRHVGERPVRSVVVVEGRLVNIVT